MGTIIKVEHLSHRYSVQWAIKDINIEIPRKGIYGLLGSNGAGKSTLMNSICGIIKPTEGKIYIDSVEVGENPILAKSKIGFLPQQPPVYGDLNVYEYLYYAAELRGMETRDIPAAIERVLELCQIAHFRKRLIRNLSGGYQQRVGIAQTIIHQPSIVIFDEPTNGLDPNQVADIRSLIRLIAEEHTVIFSTHILQEVRALCEHIYMIEQGEVAFDGSIEEFDSLASPDSIFVTLRDAPALSSIELIEGVMGVEELGDDNFRIRFSDARLAMDGLVRASMENRWRMTEIRLEKKSLETIFAELVQQAKERQ